MEPPGPLPVPPDTTTTPDPLPWAAYELVGLLTGERIRRAWKTGRGYLVMTNLRLINIWYRTELFARSEWHLGSSFFFYNLAGPRVLFGRYLELSEDFEENAGTLRFHVADPVGVAQEIEAARRAGRQEWATRRAQRQVSEGRLLRALPERTPVIVEQVVREIVKIRCNFCGSLMDIANPHCPACGAPNTLAFSRRSAGDHS